MGSEIARLQVISEVIEGSNGRVVEQVRPSHRVVAVESCVEINSNESREKCSENCRKKGKWPNKIS
jgi:hypothetical protein